jgi:hypothetical protein
VPRSRWYARVLTDDARLGAYDRFVGATTDVSDLSVIELLRLSAAASAELRRRGVLRTGNAPLGDYIEWLAARALGGQLAPNSEKSYDLETPDRRRVQVKSRRVDAAARPGQLQTSPFRSWEFDEALLVLVDPDTFLVRRASLVPRAAVEKASRYSKHVNGRFVMMDDSLMGHPASRDVTEQLQTAAR